MVKSCLVQLCNGGPVSWWNGVWCNGVKVKRVACAPEPPHLSVDGQFAHAAHAADLEGRGDGALPLGGG